VKTHEKIETVVESWRRRGTLMGTCGELTPLRGGLMRVECDGLTVIVCRAEGYWCVQFKGFTGMDTSLIEASRLALEGGKNVTVSTNYQVDTTM